MSGTHTDQLQAILHERDRYKAALMDISKGHLGPCPYVQKAREALGIAGVPMPTSPLTALERAFNHLSGRGVGYKNEKLSKTFRDAILQGQADIADRNFKRASEMLEIATEVLKALEAENEQTPAGS